jgi:glycosyltransferase involved in cell wall biosynthesis
MASLFASCDGFLGPSGPEEGFGLPAAEALAGGIPSVLSEIPSFLSWDPRHDYALFAPARDHRAMAERLTALLADSALRTRLAARGREVVEQFRAERTARRLEQWFLSRLRPR